MEESEEYIPLNEVVPFLGDLEEKDLKKQRKETEVVSVITNSMSLAPLEVIATTYEDDPNSGDAGGIPFLVAAIEPHQEP